MRIILWVTWFKPTTTWLSRWAPSSFTYHVSQHMHQFFCLSVDTECEDHNWSISTTFCSHLRFYLIRCASLISHCAWQSDESCWSGTPGMLVGFLGPTKYNGLLFMHLWKSASLVIEMGGWNKISDWLATIAIHWTDCESDGSNRIVLYLGVLYVLADCTPYTQLVRPYIVSLCVYIK